MGNAERRITTLDGNTEHPRSAKRAVIGLCLALVGALPARALAFDSSLFLGTYDLQLTLSLPEFPDPQVKFLKYVDDSPYGSGSEQAVYTVPEGHVVNFSCTTFVQARSGATIHTAPKNVFLVHYSARIKPDPPESFIQVVDPEDVFGNVKHIAKRTPQRLEWRAHGGGDHQVICKVTDPPGLAIETAILRVKPLPKKGDIQIGKAKTANVAHNLPVPIRIGHRMQPGKAQLPNAPTLAKSAWADLVITAATVKVSQHCAPNQPVLQARVIVRNVGKQLAPAKSGIGMVQARDTVTANWGNGTGTPALAPGKSAQLQFPIYYLRSNPAVMTGHHAFEFTVNGGHWVNEARTDNDRFGPVIVTIPAKFCAAGRTLKRASPRAVQTVRPKLNPQPEPPSSTHRLSLPVIHR